MTIAQSHPQSHIQDLYDQIKMLSEMLAKSCASLQAAEREKAHWAQQWEFREQEIEELIADEEEWCFHRRVWLSAQGIEC